MPRLTGSYPIILMLQFSTSPKLSVLKQSILAKKCEVRFRIWWHHNTHLKRGFTHGTYCKLPLTLFLSSMIAIYFSYITPHIWVHSWLYMLGLPPLSSTSMQLQHECCMSSGYSLYACITITLVDHQRRETNFERWEMNQDLSRSAQGQAATEA